MTGDGKFNRAFVSADHLMRLINGIGAETFLTELRLHQIAG